MAAAVWLAQIGEVTEADPQAEDAIYDSEAMRRFARVELGDDVSRRVGGNPPHPT